MAFTWGFENGGMTLALTYADLITGATGQEGLYDLVFANGGTGATINVDLQRFFAASSKTLDEPTITVSLGDPVSRNNVVVKAGDVVRARKSGGTATVTWGGTVRTL